MNNPNIPHTRALLLVFLPIFLSLATAIQTSLLVQTCKRTSDAALCLSSLSSNPRTPSARDVKTLALIELDTISTKTNATVDTIIQLLNNTTDEYMLRAYGSCVDTFGGIVVNRIPQGIAALNSKNYAEAKNQVGLVQSDVQLCFEHFSEKQPFTSGSKLVSRLAGVAIGIISLLH
ncbi:unnamed protein product [Linum trigynum]|uniref:Pectinesterase inhibitor domain-containing protein n=1 Tax=Linum trigynum TaxID=586398 RepID=A0AAV2FHH7_9ROSI